MSHAKRGIDLTGKPLLRPVILRKRGGWWGFWMFRRLWHLPSKHPFCGRSHRTGPQIIDGLFVLASPTSCLPGRWRLLGEARRGADLSNTQQTKPHCWALAIVKVRQTFAGMAPFITGELAEGEMYELS